MADFVLQKAVAASFESPANQSARYDIIFQKTKNQTSLQIFFSTTYLTRVLAIIHKDKDREAIAAACRKLETVAMDFYATNGWCQTWGSRIAHGHGIF